MQLLEILATLNPAELATLEERVKSQGRSALTTLYNELDQLPKEMESLSLQFPWLKRNVAKELTRQLEKMTL